MRQLRSSRWAEKFCRANSGSVAAIFGLVLIPLTLFIGGAVDFLTIEKTRLQLQGLLDSAALAGTTATVNALKSGASATSAQAAGVNAAKASVNAGLTSFPYASGTTFIVTPTVDAVNATYVVNATTRVTTNFLKLVGVGAVPVTVKATSSTSSGNQYMDIFLMIDTSGSTMLGASQADINALIAQFGCAFACHDGSAATAAGDAYQWATTNGVTLRYGALFQGVTALVNYINTIDPAHTRINLAVYSFDSSLNLIQSLSNNVNNVLSNYPQPAVDDSVTGGATLFNENIGSVLSAIGSGGTGATPTNRSKLLIIATDGVEDPGRQWTSNASLQADVKGFDMSFCQTAHNNGVSVGIIDTPYLPMSWDWGYNATLGQPSTPGPTRLDEISPALRGCAGNLYVNATDATTIRSAFTTIMQNFKATRLTH